MVVSPFTVAALTTTAVADLDATTLSTYTSGTTGECESVLITGADGTRYLARYPNSSTVQDALIDELKPLSALSAGIRARLPFIVPREAGRTQAGDRTLFVYTFVPGHPLNVNRIRPLSPLGDSLATGIAAIHSLPRGFVDDYGLPHLGASQVRGHTRGILERAIDSRKLPPLLAHRWDEALDADALWDFEPLVIHGNLDEHALLVDGERLESVLNWGQLRIGDPAQDLSWFVHSTRDAVASSMLAAYTSALEGTPDPHLRQRAMLYAEMALAEWLVFGVSHADATIIEDAERMLTHLNNELEQDVMHPLVPERTVSPAAPVREPSEQASETPDLPDTAAPVDAPAVDTPTPDTPAPDVTEPDTSTAGTTVPDTSVPDQPSEATADSAPDTDQTVQTAHTSETDHAPETAPASQEASPSDTPSPAAGEDPSDAHAARSSS